MRVTYNVLADGAAGLVAWLNVVTAGQTGSSLHVTLPSGTVLRGNANLTLPSGLQLVIEGQGQSDLESSSKSGEASTTLDLNAMNLFLGDMLGHSGRIEFRNMSITHGLAEHGGAIYMVGGSIAFDDCAIKTAAGRGGLIYMKNGSAVLHGCTILLTTSGIGRDVVEYRGGVVYLEAGGSVTLDHSVVSTEDEFEELLGALVYMEAGGSVILTYSNISYILAATALDGLVYMAAGGVATLDHCRMTELLGVRQGGILHMKGGGSATLSYCFVQTIQIYAVGGVVYMEAGASVSIRFCNISTVRFQYKPGTSNQGGLVYLSLIRGVVAPSATFDGCSINDIRVGSGPKLVQGGIVYSEGGLVVFDNCKIVGIGDPTTWNAIDGAIVFSKMTISRAVLTSCVMSEIYALNGGVVYMIYGSVAIVDCTMSAIDASNSGGIIYQALHGSASIDNCTMTGISAGIGRSGKGGLVYAERSVTLTNCTASDVFAVRRERHHARFPLFAFHVRLRGNVCTGTLVPAPPGSSVSGRVGSRRTPPVVASASCRVCRSKAPPYMSRAMARWCSTAAPCAVFACRCVTSRKHRRVCASAITDICSHRSTASFTRRAAR